MSGSRGFGIHRGVKQGDVISPLLFNAGIEAAFRAWKNRLRDHGFLMAPNTTRLTNTRYADDVMLFAKTAEELIQMVELLIEAFGKVGLELNTAKSKILTNDSIEYSYLDIAENLVEVVEPDSHHKYLGRYLSGEYIFRERVEINHRIQCVWMKFGQHRKTLCNQNVSIHLRLKLFDAVVTPTLIFGLAVLPLSTTSLEKIAVLQRKMLR